MSVCKKCSTENDGAAKFCEACGASLLALVRGDSGGPIQLAEGKNRFLAPFLGFFLPGLGQLYNGDRKKAALMFFGWLIGDVACAATFGATLFVSFVFWVWGMVDAYRVAARKAPIWA